jgi:hypothetical protein
MKKFIFALFVLATVSTSFAGPLASGGLKAPAAAKLKFYSIGAGIDEELKDSVDEIISDYAVAGLVAEQRSSGYGPEGEVEVCVLLNDYHASVALNTYLQKITQKRMVNLSFHPDCK